MNRLMKDTFMSTVKSNVYNSYHKQFILNHANLLIDAIQAMGCAVYFVPTYNDKRFFEVRDEFGRPCGQIFATKDKFNSYLVTPDFYLNYHVDKRKNENMYIRQINYKKLELLEGEIMEEKFANLTDKNKEFALFEFKGKQYLSNKQLETKEVFSNNYLNTSQTTILTLNEDTNKIQEETLEGVCYLNDRKGNHKVNIRATTDNIHEARRSEIIGKKEIYTAIPALSFRVSNGMEGYKLAFNAEEIIKSDLTSLNTISANELE